MYEPYCPPHGRRHYYYDRTTLHLAATSLPARGCAAEPATLATPKDAEVERKTHEMQTQTPYHAYKAPESTAPKEAREAPRESEYKTGAVPEKREIYASPLKDESDAIPIRIERSETPRQVHEKPTAIGSPEYLLHELPSLRAFLESLGLSGFESGLRSKGIVSVTQLAYLSEADLRELGLTRLERAMIRNKLHQYGLDFYLLPASPSAANPSDHRGESPRDREAKRAKQEQRPTSTATKARKRNVEQEPSYMQPTFSSIQQQARGSESEAHTTSGETTSHSEPSLVPLSSRHELHPSHPPAWQDNLYRPPPASLLVPEIPVPRAAMVPESPSHLNPTATVDYWLRPNNHELSRPSSARSAYPLSPSVRRHYKNEESDPFALPMPTFRTHLTPQDRAQYETPGCSPPVVHAADYPLETPCHNNPPMHFAGDLKHSRHPPHLSHPMVSSDEV